MVMRNRKLPFEVTKLLEWMRDSVFHMQIKSCVFHYEQILFSAPNSTENGLRVFSLQCKEGCYAVQAFDF